MRMLSAQCDADLETYKNEPILTKPIVQNFTLNNNDPIFTKFRDYMDSAVMESVEGINGNFSEFTKLILSFEQSHQFAK